MPSRAVYNDRRPYLSPSSSHCVNEIFTIQSYLSPHHALKGEPMFRRIISIIMYVMVVLYVFMLCDLFFRYNVIFDANRVVARSLNLVPFQTIWEYASGSNHLRASLPSATFWGISWCLSPSGCSCKQSANARPFGKAC